MQTPYSLQSGRTFCVVPAYWQEMESEKKRYASVEGWNRQQPCDVMSLKRGLEMSATL
jgi:hypothetical protein